MRGAPKLTKAELDRWMDKCPRCGGRVCTIALNARCGRMVCNECQKVVRYYSGDRVISRKEYERAVERDEEKRRRAEARVPSSYGHLVEEEMAMTKVKAKGKAVKKGSKKAKAAKPKAAPNKKIGKKSDGPRKESMTTYIRGLMTDGGTVESISKAAIKKFGDKNSTRPSGIKGRARLDGVKLKDS